MNRLTFTVEGAKDGGLVVYSDNGNAHDMDLVFAGNIKDSCDYLSKRVGEIKPDALDHAPAKLSVVTRKQSLRDSILNDAMIAEA